MFVAFSEVIEWLYAKLPVFQHSGSSAYKPDITNTQKLLENLGNPHEKLTFIHVAGTNGKGSVSHSMSSILSTCGYKTGLYTSPHLISFTERIKIDGVQISEQWILDFCNKNIQLVEEIQPSFFEFTFAMSMQYLFENQVDIAVIEVGMGGRLDSTNIIQPILSVITNISMDHVQFLGNTLEAIAGEKAGIIKSKIPVIIGEKQEIIRHVFEAKALEMNTQSYYAEDVVVVKFKKSDMFETQGVVFWNDVNYPFTFDLGGEYQKKNIQTIFAICKKLVKMLPKITIENILSGISAVKINAGFRGRMDKIQENPLIFLDVAHNEAGVQYLIEVLKNHTGTLRIVWGMVGDKDAQKIFTILPRAAMYYWVEPSIFRKKSVEKLSNEALEYGLQGKICGSVKNGIEQAISDCNAEDWIVVTGSCFVVADALPA